MAITPERLAQLRKELFGRLYRLKPADENQNFAAKFREAQKEIDRLRRLEAAVVNREFVWQCPWTDCEDTTYCQDAICAALLTTMKEETK